MTVTVVTVAVMSMNRESAPFPYRASPHFVGHPPHTPTDAHRDRDTQARFATPDHHAVSGIFDEFASPDEYEDDKWIPGNYHDKFIKVMRLRGYLRQYDGRGEVIA